MAQHTAPIPTYTGSQTEFSKVWIRGSTATSTLPNIKLYRVDGRLVHPVAGQVDVTIVHTAAATLYARIQAAVTAADATMTAARFAKWWDLNKIAGFACDAITGDTLLVNRAETKGLTDTNPDDPGRNTARAAADFYAQESIPVGTQFRHGAVPGDSTGSNVQVTVNGRIRAAITAEMQAAVSQAIDSTTTTMTLANSGFVTLLYEPSSVTGACTVVVETLSVDGTTWTAIPTFEALSSAPSLTTVARAPTLGVLRAANIYGTASVRIRQTSGAGTGATIQARLTGVEIRPALAVSSGVTQSQVYGATAQGTVVGSGNAAAPVLSGLEARSTDPTAVASAAVARLIGTLLGKAVVMPYAIPGQTWQYAGPAGGITDTSDDEVKAAGAAGVRNYLTRLQVSNMSTTATEVVIKDGSTVIWREEFDADGGKAGMVVNFDPPLRGTAATALNVACLTTSAKVYVNAQGFTAAE